MVLVFFIIYDLSSIDVTLYEEFLFTPGENRTLIQHYDDESPTIDSILLNDKAGLVPYVAVVLAWGWALEPKIDYHSMKNFYF